MQKIFLLNFEQNDREGGKWARPRYAGPHWNEQDCSHGTKMFQTYDKLEATRHVLCTHVREIQRFQSLRQSVTQLAAKCDPACRKVWLSLPQSVTQLAAKCHPACRKVWPSLPQSVTQLAAKCDSMGLKAEILHSAKEGYIRTLSREGRPTATFLI